MNRHDVLILSDDPLAAALLGSAVELAGSRPHFPEPHEPARDALRRVRPGLVVVDGDHPDAGTESFLGPALMTGARLVLFRSGPRGGHREGGAGPDPRTTGGRRLALDVLHLPEDLDLFLRRISEPLPG